MSAEIYKLIQVTGSDAGEFLQGQLTQDVDRVAEAGSLPAAWCNPKGRVITVMRIVPIEGGYGLVVPASMADSICERLKIFRFRADVGLEVAGPEWTCLVIDSDDVLQQLADLELRPEQAINACRIVHGLIAINIGIEEKCVELMGFETDLNNAGIDSEKTASVEILRNAKIRAGIPEILENNSEKYTPHMLNLDLLGAISFDKGCYTGQEVVARTHHLGSSKRRLMRYRAGGTVSCGARLGDGDRKVGEVINVAGRDLLALTPVELHDRELMVDGVEVSPLPLPYASTD